jgi:hypothetical protein
MVRFQTTRHRCDGPNSVIVDAVHGALDRELPQIPGICIAWPQALVTCGGPWRPV